MRRIVLRKIVSAAEAAKSPEECWCLISWSITFECSMMLKASIQPEIKFTNAEEDVLMRWNGIVSYVF